MNKIIFKQRLGDWIPKQEVMDFLGYKSTQMNEFIRKHQMLRVSRIGRRTFINISSLIAVLELHEKDQ